MSKQVIVMRKDLNMRKGKIAAQAAHASLKVFLDQCTFNSGGFEYRYPLWSEARDESDYELMDSVKEWLAGNFKKVCVYVESEAELGRLYGEARKAGLPCSMVVDAGLTEFKGVPTKTCIAIGPAPDDRIDAITGELPLL